MKRPIRKIVVINQAANYLTVSICNEFKAKFDAVALITGNVHEQGEALDANISISYINKWKDVGGFRKAKNYLFALIRMFYLLMTKYRKHEVFFVSVPPMGYLLNLILPHRFSMLIWDVYPDVFKITGMKESHFIYVAWSKLNRRSFKKAFKLFTIGDKMADLIAEYVSREKIIIQPIWSIFQENNKIEKKDNAFIKTHKLQDKFIVQYSGNIGLTHKVEIMIELAKKMKDHKDILFQIIGRGPRVKELKNMVKDGGLNNCQFLPFQSDEMFPYSLSAADIGVVILDELTSKGSVPSKSYNLMSYGIPALYFAAADSELNTYAAKFDHAKCFTESEIDQAVDFVLEMKNDKVLYRKLSKNSILASGNFKRKNAEKLILKYMD